MVGSEIKISELLAGKKSLKDRIMNVSKDSGIKEKESQITKAKNSLETYDKLCRYIDAVMVSQIKAFKQLRTKAYYEMIKIIMKQ